MEDLGKVKNEIEDLKHAFFESVKDQGEDNRNFFGQLRSVRLSKELHNLMGKDISILQEAYEQGVIDEHEFKMTLKEVVESTVGFLGIDAEIFYTDEPNMPKDNKGNIADIKEEEESYKIYIDVTKINTTSELIGTVFEEVSHAFDHQAGRQLEMTDGQKARGEYGLESLGRATNTYFQELYKENDSEISLTSDGVDYSNVEGNTVGYGIVEEIKEAITDQLTNFFRKTVEGVNSIDGFNKLKKELKPVLDTKYRDLSIYNEVLKIIGKYSLFKTGSPYEVLYLLTPEERKNILDDNNNLMLHKFDPKGWKRVTERETYKQAVETIKLKALSEGFEHLSKNPFTSRQEIKNINDSIATDVHFEESNKYFNKNIRNSLEFALGNSRMIGTVIIKTRHNKNGSIHVEIDVRYNLSDSFKDIDYIPGEYGYPYDMIGEQKIENIYRNEFKNKEEYLKFLKKRR